MSTSIQVMISENQIRKCILELGEQITSNYKNSQHNMILVGLLRGSFIFIADLCRSINISHELDFMTISSYGNNVVSNTDVKILKDLDVDIRNKNVIIIEDIIDSGHTLCKVKKMLQLRKPHSLKICTLLNKVECREVYVQVDYSGFEISDEFVVGYGIDYAQYYRNLPYIAKVCF